MNVVYDAQSLDADKKLQQDQLLLQTRLQQLLLLHYFVNSDANVNRSNNE